MSHLTEPLNCEAQMKSERRFVLMVGALLCVPLVGLMIWFLSQVIWLPDLLSLGKTHVIGSCTLPNGETVELTQEWNGDGYLTGIRHLRPGSMQLFTVGDGDAARALVCHTLVQTNDGCVTFGFSGKQWRYYWGGPLGGQFLARKDGRTYEPN